MQSRGRQLIVTNVLFPDRMMIEISKRMAKPHASLYTRVKRWFRRPSNPAGNVYYVRLNTPQGLFYKIGFTTKASLVERMAYGGHGDEKLIDKEIFFTRSNDAWDLEQTLLDHFSKHRAFGKYSKDPAQPLSGRGQSELFSSDILGLDDSLYAPQEITKLEACEHDSKQAAGGCLGILIGLVLIPFTLGISLFFILGGLMDFFAAAQNRTLVEKRDIIYRPRPKHPEEIQAIIDSLSKPEISAKTLEKTVA
ncbi:hypothetical protein [Pseudomonas oryzae]|uniref:Uncharacterized protein n=1 Tax=Pseudomonas oryzae TaxID=1392877 RepID=A0A1H1PA46_9PSED|nr:hypothetical protein [Pseudomonas oryzae]SDS08023.1 hypothetical protein SAMN05216221_1024 [Pseudomonas oryzae]